MKLLGENKFDISWKNLWKVFAITFIIIVLSPFSFIEKIISKQKIKDVQLKKPPIFILGHWRSGTTFLHELLHSDPNLEYMTLTESVFPNLFLYFYGFIKRIFGPFLPETRPQDNVRINTEFASEHDFAIANVSSMSPYSGAYFPKNQDFYNKYVSLEGLTEKQILKLKESINYVIKKLTIRKRYKQLVLKSPVDTARIDMLLDLFPDAKFIHIERNPYHVFFSTKRMHEKLVTIMMMQNIHPDLDEFVLQTYEELMSRYLEQVHLIPKGNLIEIKYEHFIKEPLQTVEKIYEKLSISDFEQAKPYFMKYLEKHRNYKSATYKISDSDKERIYKRWHQIINRLGYEAPHTH
ncbi:MAG: sulfotransferase family protein [Candidatus Heimdallarchaeaceae archaeon]